MSYSTYFKTCVFFQTFQMEIRLVQFFEFLIMILLILVSVSIYTFENLGFAAFASQCQCTQMQKKNFRWGLWLAAPAAPQAACRAA